MLPASSRPRSEIAISVPPSGSRRGTNIQAFEPLVVRQRCDARRHRDRLAARQQAVARRNRTARCGCTRSMPSQTVPPSSAIDSVSYQPRAASGLPSRPEHRRHLGIRDAGRARALIDDAPAQPASLVGDGEEARAVGARRGSPRCRRTPGRTRSATCPPRKVSGPKRTRCGSRGSNAAIGRARDFDLRAGSGSRGARLGGGGERRGEQREKPSVTRRRN